MSRRRKNDVFSEAIVGLFMIAVLALLVYFTIVISGVDVLKGRQKVVANIAFNGVGGLKEHDNVMYRGTKVGGVEDILVTPSNLVVKIEVDKSVVLREGYRISVCSLSMLGGQFLMLEEGEGEIVDLTAQTLVGETPSDWMRDMADKMFIWELDTLWEQSQDRGIYEGWNTYRPNMQDKDGNWTGERQAGHRGQQKLHHIGTLLEGVNALYQATGEEKYLAWCWKMVNSVLVHRLDGNGIIQNVYDSKDGSWCWEFARGMTNFCADNQLWDYKGIVPLIEGEFIDYAGKKRTYTTKANGRLASFPNGWTMYQWMAACASRIKDNNGTCIVLPTNRQANAWYDLPIKAGGNLTLEAEDATLIGNAEVSRDLQASGGNTVTMNAGGWLSFFSNQRDEGFANLSIVYATGEDSRLSVVVNDNLSGTYDCPKTGSGNKVRNGVDTLTVSIFLLKGDNIIKIGSDDNDCPNIDKVILKKLRNSNINTTLEIEAENATLNGTAGVSKDLQASGGNTVTGLGNGSWLSFNYTAPISGIYDVTVQYMSETDLALAATVNDGSPIVVNCPATGGTKARNGVGTVEFSLYIAEGDNTIRLGHDTEACPVVDKISLKFSSTSGITTLCKSIDSRRERLHGWYTLQGRKLSEAPTQRGVYILNGKKVFIND